VVRGRRARPGPRLPPGPAQGRGATPRTAGAAGCSPTGGRSAAGGPAPGRDAPGWPATVVLQDILGATGRRLTEEIRDRRALATAIGPTYAVVSDAGAFSVAATTQPGNVEAVLGLALAEIRRLRDGQVTDEDVGTSLRARRLASGSRVK
jgi:predicted Zn-dependent peptidase